MKNSQTNSFKEPILEKWTLSNGASCVIAPMNDTKLICLDLWCKAGSSDELQDEDGLAHFLEHIVFKGSSNLKEGEFDLKIEEMGGTSNACTGFDDVHFHVLVPSNQTEIALHLLLDLVLRPKIDEKAFEIEREVVLEEIAQYSDSPEEQLYQQLLKLCWPNHKYGNPILGKKETINSIQPQQMRNFHNRQYLGKNCTLAIAGNIPRKIKSIVESSYLSCLTKESTNALASLNKKKVIFKTGRHEIKVPRLETPRIAMAWELPPAREQITIMGADIAVTLLAEGRLSRLVKTLREELRLIESIIMDLTVLEQSGMILLETCCPEENISQVENEINTTINQLIQSSVNKQELKRANQLVRNSFYFSLELSNQVAEIIGSQMLWGRHQSILEPLEQIPYWTEDRLQEKIFGLMNPEKCLTLIARSE